MRTLLVAAFCALAPAAPAQSLLWKATSPRGTVYLLGAIHLMRPEAYPLPDAIEKAYAETDALVLEMDLAQAQSEAGRVMARGLYADGSGLCDHVADTTCALVEQQAGAALAPAIGRMKPWLAGMTLSVAALQQAGYRPELGLDAHFHARALADGRPRFGLETMDEQIGFLDGLAPAEQEQMLYLSLREAARTVAQVDTLAALWQRGDADALLGLAGADLEALPQFRERLLAGRNRAWVPQIEALVAEGRTPFVVVGALHLLGSDGVLALLERRGYRVAQQ